MPTPRKRKTRKKVAVSPHNGRPIIYPKNTTELHGPDNPLKASQCQDLLGWTVVDSKAPRSEYDLKDLDGNKIRLTNNVQNRPIYNANKFGLMQEILRNRWKYNREPIIIGETGLILNGQHTLLSVVLCEQERLRDPERWEEYWDGGEVFILKDVAFGCAEDDDTVNTLDTCRPRSLTDVVFRSHFFQDLGIGARRKCSKYLDFAVRFLWKRTGVKDRHSIHRSHSESLDFMVRHPKLFELVRYCHDLEGPGNKKRLSSLTPNVGILAGHLYLMASSQSNPMEYYDAEPHTEDALDWSNEQDARELFHMLAYRHEDVQEIMYSLAGLNDADTGVKAAPLETYAMLCRAWEVYINGDPLTEQTLTLEDCYVVDDSLIRVMVTTPKIGGIDLGEEEEWSGMMSEIMGMDEEDEYLPDDPSPEEVALRAEGEKERRLAETKALYEQRNRRT